MHKNKPNKSKNLAFVKDKEGRNALDWAKRYGYDEILPLLKTKKEKGLWDHVLSGCQSIYNGIKRIIPERFLKLF